MIIIDSFSKIGNSQVVQNLFPKKLIRDLLESHQLINKIIILCLKIFFFHIIFPLFNDPFNNDIAFLESKVIYFFLRLDFRECSTLINCIDSLRIISRFIDIAQKLILR